MNLKLLKNGIGAAVIGASTLGGTLVKVPSFEVRQAQKAVAEAVQQVKKCQAEFTQDSIAFTTKKIKTAADSAALNKSEGAVISAELKKIIKDIELANAEYFEKYKSNLIEATVEDAANAVYQGWNKLSNKTTEFYNKLIK